jgi:hypothetical protein
MKRKTEVSLFDDLQDNFAYAKLYREDLDEILELAAEKSLKVIISDDKYEYENLDEVIEQKGMSVALLKIEIKGDEGLFEKLSLIAEAHEITIRSSKVDSLIPLYHHIKELVQKRSSWRFKLIRPWLYAYSLVGLLWLRPLDETIENLPELSAKINLIIYGLFSILALYSYVFKKYYRGILLSKEHEVTNFLQRNSDKLIFTLIGFALGITGKIVSDLFFK